MIKKERLEELIEKGKPIYSTDTKLYGCVRMLELENQLEKLQYDKNGEVKLFIADNGWWHWFSLKDLYESKEEVEELLEFGNITRTERLELNNYETFLKSNTGTMFYLNACEHLLHKVRHSADDENPDWRIEVCVFYNDLEESSEVLYSKPLTRENYNEARRLCVKLFKGEEV